MFCIELALYGISVDPHKITAELHDETGDDFSIVTSVATRVIIIAVLTNEMFGLEFSTTIWVGSLDTARPKSFARNHRQTDGESIDNARLLHRCIEAVDCKPCRMHHQQYRFAVMFGIELYRLVTRPTKSPRHELS